jgi:putative colanic acid biosynthesis acetyltransferase WcaF
MGARRLDLFTGHSYDKQRPLIVQALWLCTSSLIQCWWIPNAVRLAALKLFGARIGSGVIIRSRVRVHWPWKLQVEDHSWIGEGAWLLNLEPIHISSHVCISQEALLCTGSHDRHDPAFEFKNAPITIGSGAWICARAIVLAGSAVGEGAVVSAGSVVRGTIVADL